MCSHHNFFRDAVMELDETKGLYRIHGRGSAMSIGGSKEKILEENDQTGVLDRYRDYSNV